MYMDSPDNISDTTSTDDLLEIKNTFINHLFTKINNYAHELFNDPTDELIDNLKDITTTPAVQNEELSEWLADTWKEGLSSEDIDKYTKQLIDLKKKINSEIPTIPEIMDADISDEDKSKAVQLYDLIKALPNFTEEYKTIKKALEAILNKEETGEADEIEKQLLTTDETPLKRQILLSNYSLAEKNILYKKLKFLDIATTDETEKEKNRTTISIALELDKNPVLKPALSNKPNNEEFNSKILELQHELNKNIYGLNDVKEEIISILCTRYSNPDATGQVIVLEGPPGCGKTQFVLSLGKVQNLPVHKIPFGGANDPAYLEGFLGTYASSQAGIIVNTMLKAKCKNPIILGDEVDKIEEGHKGQAVNGVLLSCFDPTQNKNFYDKRLDGISTDLSHIWWFLTCNDANKIDPILLDRCKVIKIRAPKLEEKIGIAREHSFKKAHKFVGWDTSKIKILNSGFYSPFVRITNENIEYIIKKSKIEEKGVRIMEHNIQTILKKINVLKLITLKNSTIGKVKLSYSIPNFKLPLTLDKNIIDILFEEEKKEILSYYI